MWSLLIWVFFFCWIFLCLIWIYWMLKFCLILVLFWFNWVWRFVVWLVIFMIWGLFWVGFGDGGGWFWNCFDVDWKIDVGCCLLLLLFWIVVFFGEILVGESSVYVFWWLELLINVVIFDCLWINFESLFILDIVEFKSFIGIVVCCFFSCEVFLSCFWGLIVVLFLC